MAEDSTDDVVEVVGVAVPAAMAAPNLPRPKVVIVTEAWGANWGEPAAATRLIAGALALRATVMIVSIDNRSALRERDRQPRVRYDGLFRVYSVTGPPVPDGAELRTNLVRASFHRQAGAVIPEVVTRGLLDNASRPSPEALVTALSLEPDVIVLAGEATFWLGAALPTGDDRPRIVLLPLSGDDPALSSPAFLPVADLVDSIGAFSDLEYGRIAAALPGDAAAKLCRMNIAFPVNHLAATASMAGVSSFGRYVLVISGFDEDPASGQCPAHDYLRQVIGDVAVAEVKRGRWLVTGGGRRYDMSWVATRMNMWRLMARAAVTIDVRPPGPVGREAIESLRFATPVVVPDSSVAAEHAARSNGGLWYRSQGEMIDCIRTLLDNPRLRDRMGQSGHEWAERYHGDTDAFVEDTIRLVIGSAGEPAPEPTAAAAAAARAAPARKRAAASRR